MKQPKSISSSNLKQVKPWPLWALFLLALPFGFGASFMLIWRNLKRMGYETQAQVLVKWGIPSFILFSIALYFLSDLIRGVDRIFAIVILVWFQSQYFRKWQNQSDAKTQLSWGVLGWALLGFLAELLLLIAFALIENAIFGPPR